MGLLKIQNCYDSHVHWLKTGEIESYVPLKNLKKPDDVVHLKIEPHHYKGDWLMGFGWDQNDWQDDKKLPTKEVLDKYFPNHPVHFIRTDVHASWVNSKALKLMGLFDKNSHQFPDPEGGVIIRDKDDLPTGVLIDTARDLVFAAEPQKKKTYLKQSLIRGMREFNQQGITHIRDMTCTLEQWHLARELEDQQELTLGVEEFFFHPSAEDYGLSIKDAIQARHEEKHLLKVKGIKIFADGALGSEGAYISQPYKSGSGQGCWILNQQLIQEIMIKSWESRLTPAIHAIGDQAVHEVVMAAFSLKQDRGIQGPIHIEHAQIVRDETIEKMKSLQVTCFFQPCHWLSDRDWLESKVGHLIHNTFPWRKMEDRGIPFFFGSDCPVEPAWISRNQEAIVDAEKVGIPAPQKQWSFYHSHPEKNWLKNTYSKINGKSVEEVIFQGDKIV